MVDELANLLVAQGKWLVTAESCTGGLIAATLTAVPGSSAWFEAGFVTYQPSAKVRLLGVTARTLERYSAVSEPVARQMAEGALANSDADISVAVTGLAGPTGGEPTHPVGEVWIAWADRDNGFLQADRCALNGDRNAIRDQAVHAAIAGLINALTDPG